MSSVLSCQVLLTSVQKAACKILYMANHYIASVFYKKSLLDNSEMSPYKYKDDTNQTLQIFDVFWEFILKNKRRNVFLCIANSPSIKQEIKKRIEQNSQKLNKSPVKLPDF